MNVSVRMSGRFTVQTGEPTPPPASGPVLKRVRKWGDKWLVEHCGWTTANVGSNFQPVMLAVFNANGMAEFGGVHIFQRVDEAFLKGLQYEQLDKSPVYGELNRIYNWLINSATTAGRPYWYKDGRLVFGCIMFGGQLVQLETGADGKPLEFVRRGRYANETDRDIRPLTFYRLQGIRKAQVEAWKAEGRDGRAYHPQFPHLIQHATSADVSGDVMDIYNEYPRGTEIFHPVWDWRDYPHNLGSYDPGLYISRDFLEA